MTLFPIISRQQQSEPMVAFFCKAFVWGFKHLKLERNADNLEREFWA